MRFGCCVSPDKIGIIAEAGFDYCELTASTVLPFEDDATALPTLRELEAAPLRAEAFNVLVPAQVPLVGPQRDSEQIRSYLRRTFGRMRQIGGEVVVLGSGGARRIPDGYDRAQGLNELADSLSIAGEEALKAGIILVLEHLNKKETNVFNSVAEGQAFIEERSIKGLELLADLYHLELEEEPFANVVAAAPYLKHAHVAGGGRRSPDTPGYDYSGFMQALHSIGYDSRISAECGWDDLAAQAPTALAYMRAQWEQ
jgi:D-psicose/D-tagatose/L-ribulose 3-epimerase